MCIVFPLTLGTLISLLYLPVQTINYARRQSAAPKSVFLDTIRWLCHFGGLNSYLPGSGDTVITKAVPPGRGPSIALRLG